MDAMPDNRKNNRYCQYIGLCDWITSESKLTPVQLIQMLGTHKYLSANTFHLAKSQRPTIEFRLAEGECCLNSYNLKNWVRLIIHFIERAKVAPTPPAYQQGNPWSSYCWLDPMEVLELLGWSGQCVLSSGMEQVRSWFLARILKHLGQTSVYSMSAAARCIAYEQVSQMAHAQELSLHNILEPSNMEEAVYGEIYRY